MPVPFQPYKTVFGAVLRLFCSLVQVGECIFTEILLLNPFVTLQKRQGSCCSVMHCSVMQTFDMCIMMLGVSFVT